MKRRFLFAAAMLTVGFVAADGPPRSARPQAVDPSPQRPSSRLLNKLLYPSSNSFNSYARWKSNKGDGIEKEGTDSDHQEED